MINGNHKKMNTTRSSTVQIVRLLSERYAGISILLMIVCIVLLLLLAYELSPSAVFNTTLIILTGMTLGYVVISMIQNGAMAKDNTLTDVFSNEVQAIVLVDQNGKIARANGAAEKMFGYGNGALSGLNIKTIIPDAESLLHTGAGSEPQSIIIRKEVHARKYNKTVFPAAVGIHGFSGAKNEMNIIFIQDLTDRVMELNSLRSELGELKNTNRATNAFESSVSHDLKASLRAICGYTTILREEHGNLMVAEGRRLVSSIGKNAHHIVTLMEKLHSFSNLEKGAIKKTVLDMTGVAGEVIQEINQAKAHSARIVISPLHQAVGDQNTIRFVLRNLLHNAIKFSSVKANPVVQVKSVETYGEIVFSVEDNGIGFNMKYADKLFDAFHRLHGENGLEGTGTGLYMTKRMIQRHGGKVWAVGKENGGATFYFSLPCN